MSPMSILIVAKYFLFGSIVSGGSERTSCVASQVVPVVVGVVAVESWLRGRSRWPLWSRS